MTERNVDELLHHWRMVIGSAPEGWARNFALSIQRARRRPAWEPTEKQLRVMRHLVSDLFVNGDSAEVDFVEGS